MKKILSLILILISLFTVLSLSASAEEIMVKGFTFDVPDGFVRDKKYEKKFGVDRYWHNEEKGIEIILSASEDSYLFNLNENDNSYTKRHNYEELFNDLSVSHPHEFSMPGDIEVWAIDRMFYKEDGNGKAAKDPYIVMYEYHFPVTEYEYTLSFFVNDQEDSEFTDSVAKTVSYNGNSAIYYTCFEDIVVAVLKSAVSIFAICAVVKTVKTISKKKKTKEANE